jgi:hypothetical protein
VSRTAVDDLWLVVTADSSFKSSLFRHHVETKPLKKVDGRLFLTES